jgi:fatty acid/phospholipid biosynthesis enzyme
MIQIAVDAMGGDEAPGRIVDGALAASRHFDLGVTLVGPAERLEDELSRHPGVDRERVRIVHADAVVEMAEAPAARCAASRPPRSGCRRAGRARQGRPRCSAPGTPARR